MSYNVVKEKLDKGKIIILDGGMGAELEKSGAKMHKDLWCGKCSVDTPDLVQKVHEDYILAGADVITTNTYGTTPISLKQYGFGNCVLEYNQKSVQIAKKAVENKIKKVVFDRNGYPFHGRVKAFAKAAREAGLEF